jgi:hypothetical protein
MPATPTAIVKAAIAVIRCLVLVMPFSRETPRSSDRPPDRAVGGAVHVDTSGRPAHGGDPTLPDPTAGSPPTKRGPP